MEMDRPEGYLGRRRDTADMSGFQWNDRVASYISAIWHINIMLSCSILVAI